MYLRASKKVITSKNEVFYCFIQQPITRQIFFDDVLTINWFSSKANIVFYSERTQKITQANYTRKVLLRV